MNATLSIHYLCRHFGGGMEFIMDIIKDNDLPLNYEKGYLKLFSAISRALAYLNEVDSQNEFNVEKVRFILASGQTEAEEACIGD